MAQAEHPHRQDVQGLAPKVAEAVRGVLKHQHAAARSAAAAGGKSAFNHKAETARLKAAVLPGFVAAVGIGAKRVAKASGGGTPSPDTDHAGALAWLFATQWTTTTANQLAELTTGTGTQAVSAVDHLFDVRAGLASLAVGTVLSNAINRGAVSYAQTLTAPPDKTSSVTDTNPCAVCQAVTGETVPATEDFSNGAPNGPFHDGCMCTVTFTPHGG